MHYLPFLFVGLFIRSIIGNEMHPPATHPIIDTKIISRFGKIADVTILQINTSTTTITTLRMGNNLRTIGFLL